MLATGNVVDRLIYIASQAAARILAIDRSTIRYWTKPDFSLLTAADKSAEAGIVTELERLFPDVPIISEEATKPRCLTNPDALFFLVGPLDGPRPKLMRRREKTQKAPSFPEENDVFFLKDAS